MWALGLFLLGAVLAVPAPPEVRSGVAAQIDQVALRLEASGRVLAELWPARSIPETPTARDGLRILYPQISPGTLVGVLRLSRAWTDARGQPIPAGIYTLRYAVQPLMKEHTGVSEHRDFVVVIPAASDDGSAEGQDEAVVRSRSAEGSHPLVFALVPAGDAAPNTLIIRKGHLNLGLRLGPGHGGP
jgi:hypothetical protein